jgi:hemoglobin
MMEQDTRKEIENRDDLFLLVERFYKKLLNDPSISYLFTDIAKINLEHHLPILVDFWDMVLFGSDTYRKNAMQPHMKINQLSAFKKEHFVIWLGYFNQTVDELFKGEVAEMAKQRAASVATMMQVKFAQHGQ